LAICESWRNNENAECDGMPGAARVLIGFRDGEAKTVASIYQTARRAARHPGSARGRRHRVMRTSTTSGCVTRIRRTRSTICSPPNDQKRLEMSSAECSAPAQQQAYEHSYRNGPSRTRSWSSWTQRHTPCTWLPLVSSTVQDRGDVVTVWQDISQIKTALPGLAGSVLNITGTRSSSPAIRF